jgi:MFS family permease
VVAHLTKPASRSDVFAWYSLLGQAGVACGLMTCGWVIQYVSTDLHWEHVDAFRLAFLGYAAVGLVMLVLTLLLSKAAEADEKASTSKKKAVSNEVSSTETSPLLGGENANGSLQATEQRTGRSRLSSFLPDISREGYTIMMSLCIFFAIDSFASGIISM